MAYDDATTLRGDSYSGSAFDEPTDDESRRDRLLVHVIWEALLAVVVAGIAVTVYQLHSEVFSGDQLRALMLGGAAVGLLAVACSISVRSAVPNLAVGPIALAAALLFAEQSHRGLTTTTGLVAGAAAAAGVVLALVVVVCHVPAWAASLAAALGLIAWLSIQSRPAVDQAVGYQPAGHAYLWFGGFAALSVLGGVVGLLPVVRRLAGRYRNSVDAARQRGAVPSAMAFVALVLSSVVAAGAGVLLVLVSRSGGEGTGFEYTGLALGAVLLGGTSAFGRRGGVLGTLFGVMLVVLVMALAEAEGWTGKWALSSAAFGGAAILIGLLVTRLVETAGRPRTADEGAWSSEDESWRGESPAAALAARNDPTSAPWPPRNPEPSSASV